jgi:hypothetical protein
MGPGEWRANPQKRKKGPAVSEIFTLRWPIRGKLSEFFTCRDFAQYRSIEFFAQTRVGTGFAWRKLVNAEWRRAQKAARGGGLWIDSGASWHGRLLFAA